MNSKSKDIVFLTHTRGQLDKTAVAQFWSPAIRSALNRCGVSLAPNFSLRAETKRTLRSTGRPVVIVACFADTSLLNVVDGSDHVVGVVVVPDLPLSAHAWAKRWGVKVDGEKAIPKSRLIEDEVVEEALAAITSTFDSPVELLTSLERRLAKRVLTELADRGHIDPTRQVASWCIRNYWKPKAAVELEKLCRRAWEADRIRDAERYTNHDLYEQWCGL